MDKKLFPHIWNLHHQVYLASGKQQKIYIHQVNEYFDALEPRQNLYYLHQ